ncbi:hypothetical protein CDD82_6698 [Ophiocordyceps australis]|uniref:Peptidase S9 prolyl oligopeptidase catalytic domain-containing protein n=1 Tax=Ophiocordyceps australis TaxID=1399860 RepID=A0A2C5ZS82_9HYPO|nr:hypothetical protein CDD82_6698 [Ophiocordyceps australis]
MHRKIVAPHGKWPSPISVASVVQVGSLSTPRVSRGGRIFFREAGLDGRSRIVEATETGIGEALPAPYSADNRVYEYGGALFDVLPDSRLVLSNSDDSVCIVDPHGQRVSVLVPASSRLRYASFSASATSPWVLAIEEAHAETAQPADVRHRIVALNVDTAKVKPVVEGADFYYQPRFSADGARLCWLEWNRPDLPFDAAKLYVAEWRPHDGQVCDTRLVAGGSGQSVAEPCWGPDGTLFFAMEQGPYRQLYSLAAGSASPAAIPLKGLEEAEHTIQPLSKHTLVAAPFTNGVQQLIAIDLDTYKWHRLADMETICYIRDDSMARHSDSSLIVVGGGTMSSPAVWKIDLHKPSTIKALRKATEHHFPTSLFSTPELINMEPKTPKEQGIRGFLWMPHNPDYTAAPDELPPLIIRVHGGPTDVKGCGVDLRTQYFTTRGYAVLGLNYHGSAGYGRDYRNALFGQWGVLDADDAGHCAQQLASTGRVRKGGIGITGLSAGGYNTLQSIVRHASSFAGAICVSGPCELSKFAATTHKLEMDYTPALALECPESIDEEHRERVYRERSPLYHTDKIKTPLLMLHGRADTVVVEDQARMMTEKLKAQGADVELVLVEGDGHKLDKPSSVQLRLELEEKMWSETLL